MSQSGRGWGGKSDLIRFNTFSQPPINHPRHLQIEPRQRSIVARLKLVDGLIRASCALRPTLKKNDGDLSAPRKTHYSSQQAAANLRDFHLQPQETTLRSSSLAPVRQDPLSDRAPMSLRGPETPPSLCESYACSQSRCNNPVRAALTTVVVGRKNHHRTSKLVSNVQCSS